MHSSISDNYIISKHVLSSKDGNSLLKSLLLGHGERFSKDFPIALESCLDYYHVGGQESGAHAESFYHAVCLGMFIQAREFKCEVQSEGTARAGRYDVRILPPAASDLYAVIMEFKIVRGKKKSSLAGGARKALLQISTHRYRSNIPQNVTKLLEVGIAFRGMSAKVVVQEYQKVENSWHRT
jgi:hypothetical protein